jgi:hypothetical protein
MGTRTNYECARAELDTNLLHGHTRGKSDHVPVLDVIIIQSFVALQGAALEPQRLVLSWHGENCRQHGHRLRHFHAATDGHQLRLASILHRYLHWFTCEALLMGRRNGDAGARTVDGSNKFDMLVVCLKSK